ncbi:membrane protein insertase YidC [Malacoplasma muris]|uniref:membrane protein insertase YidC n=1 Tax=Malacoplasma muris TaxID=2119 RepID=UPI00398F62C8
MSTESNIQSFVATPFWQSQNDPKAHRKNETKKILKVILKWLKIIIYAFLTLMGLWGCFQTMIEPETKTNVLLGQGMEFGYLWGTTGDFRYDLFGNLTGEYYTFSEWGFQYGPFFAFFVWPGARLVLEIMYATRNWWGGLNALLAIFILLFIIRGITLLISIRSTVQSERMSEIQGKIAEINAKYKNVKDMAGKQKKQMEINELYKKYNIKPFAMFEQIFVTMPIFLIVYRVVTILRPIKSASLFSIWDLGKTPLTEILNNLVNGGWVFIFFLLIVVPAQIISQKLPQWLAKKRNNNAIALSEEGKKQAKKTRMIQTVMMLVLVFIVISSPTGIGLYWFLSSLFSIAQAFIIHKLILKKRKKGITLEEKLKYLGVY